MEDIRIEERVIPRVSSAGKSEHTQHGKLIYNKDSEKLEVYSTGSSSWTEIGAGTGSSGSISLGVDEVPWTSVSGSAIGIETKIQEFAWIKEMPRKVFHYYTDFIQILSTTGTDNAIRSFVSGTGAGITELASDADERVGIARLSTGTTATGRAAGRSSTNTLKLAGGEVFFEADVRINTLSTGTERFAFLVGLMDTETAANQVDGVYFLYDEGGVSTGSTAASYWQTATVSNSTRTFNQSHTQVTVTAAQWDRLTLVVNPDGTQVIFYVNGTPIATHINNIPTTTARTVGFGFLVIKSIGTTARTVDIDYLNILKKFTTQR